MFTIRKQIINTQFTKAFGALTAQKRKLTGLYNMLTKHRMELTRVFSSINALYIPVNKCP